MAKRFHSQRIQVGKKASIIEHAKKNQCVCGIEKADFDPNVRLWFKKEVDGHCAESRCPPKENGTQTELEKEAYERAFW
jgi:hypothetical protein